MEWICKKRQSFIVIRAAITQALSLLKSKRIMKLDSPCQEEETAGTTLRR